MTLIRFVKDWTLPVAMFMGTAVYLIFANVPQLDGAATFFGPVFDAILPSFMFLILFVTFCKVDFRKMRPVAWHLWVGVAQVLMTALLMVVLMSNEQLAMNNEQLVINNYDYIQAQPLTSDGNHHYSLLITQYSFKVLLEALLMCVIAPCAVASAVVTQKLGGSLEQMTTYNFISNFITAALVPVCFPLIEKSADITFLSAFAKILHEVALVLLVPMLLAYIVKHHLHRLHRRIVGVRDLSYYLWACSLMIVTGVTVRNIAHASASAWLLAAIALLGLVVCVVQFAVGRFVGHYFNHAQEAGQGLGQKNTAFAIWLSSAYLTPLSSVGPGCYILWQNIINSVEIWQQRRQKTDPEI